MRSKFSIPLPPASTRVVQPPIEAGITVQPASAAAADSKAKLRSFIGGSSPVEPVYHCGKAVSGLTPAACVPGQNISDPASALHPLGRSHFNPTSRRDIVMVKTLT